METCPICKGEKGHYRNPNPYWLTDMEFAKPDEFAPCRGCDGKGEVTPLKAATLKAGGVPAATATGFA